MTVREFEEKDTKAVCDLVNEAFNEFVAPSFTKAGIKRWLEKHVPKEQVKRSKERDVYVAVLGDKIVGMIEGRHQEDGQGRISRLFVSKHYHKRGIAKSLVNRIEVLYKGKGIKSMVASSSLYAQIFYNKMGYKKTRGVVKSEKNGMVYQPMKKIF
jgi:ribosomal protein S18 acetylase RimI-like enzyme